MYIFWGGPGAWLYNDAYRQSIGPERHPSSLGCPAQEVWGEIWDVIGPQIEQVMGGGGATWHENQLLPITRNGRCEDVYWTYSYGPIDDDNAPNGIGGVLVVCTETTKQVHALTGLRESDERLQIALSAGKGTGTWDWNVPLDRVTADARFCWLHGVDLQRGEAGAPISELFDKVMPEDLEPLREALEVAIRSGEPFAAEYRLRSKDGTVRWVAAQGRCTMGPDGAPLRFPGVSFDITDRKAVEEELRVLNETLEAHVDERTRERDQLWEMSEDLLIVSDLQGQVLKVSPSWTRLLGLSEKDLMNGRYADLVHPEDLPVVMAAVQRMRDTRQTVSVEDRLKTIDGKWRWFSWKLSPEAASERLTGIGRDITVEREREAALKDFEDFTRLALSSVGGVGVWTYDPNADRFVCDSAIASLYGLDSEEAAAGIPSAQFFANIHPDDLPKIRTTMADAFSRSGEVELEYRIRHPNGSTRWVLSRGHTYHNDEGRPYRRTGVGIETTERHELEEQLRQSQKMEAVGQLTGGVAHDFNNLLTVIRSSIDLLKRPNLPEERRHRYIEAISDTTMRAAKLTGQLLAFSRRQALRPEVFDVTDSVRSIADMVVTLTGSRIHIETIVPDHACYVNADASQLDTALVNLAVNARDAMEGEGTLTIGVRATAEIPALRSHPAFAGEFIAISVADTGSGIAPDDLDRIFEPFFTTKGVGHGTGLGLSQVFGFVKQSGGQIAVESHLGQGANLTLYLPRVAQGALKIEPDGDQPFVDGHGTCVLVVEDNEDVGSFATQTLEELGYRSVLTVDAEQALSELAIDPDRFDVVFSDIVMPGINGIDLAREIRARHGDVPVVLTSGYSHILAQNGSHGFELLQKPYSVEQLSRVLQKVAHWRKLKRVLDA